MRLLEIKQRSSRRLAKSNRWLRLPIEFFGIKGIFIMDRPQHPLALLLREAYFNRFGHLGASIPYDAIEHFSSLIYRRWSLWPELLLKSIFERFELASDDEIKASGAFVGWVEAQIKNEIGFKEYVVGVGHQTIDELLFDAAVEQARGSPNKHFHYAVWEAASKLPDKIKRQAQEEAKCQDTHLSPISNSSSLLTGRSSKNGRTATAYLPSTAL